MTAAPHEWKRVTPEACARLPSGAGRPAAAQLDPKASAALAQAVNSAREAGSGALNPRGAGEQRLHLPRRGFDRTRQIAVHSALVLVLAGSCWFAAAAGNLTNQAALQQIAADTAQHRAALARLDRNVEVMGSLVGGLRDRAEENAASAAAAGQRLEQELARVTAAAALGPTERLTALEARLERMEQQIAAAVLTLAPRPDTPPVQARTETALPESEATPSASNRIESASPPAIRPIASTEDAISGWTLRDVYGGVALIESRNRRLFEVVPGGFVPGVGRVSSIERRNGRWIVLTDRGVIASLR